MDLSEFRARVMSVVEAEFKTLSIDEDAAPAAYFWSAETKTFYPTMLDTRFFSGVRGKEALSDVIIPDIIKRYHASMYTLVLTIWFTTMKRPNEPFSLDDVPLPSETPGRKEAVMLLAADQNNHETWLAEIRRLRKAAHPVLLKWEEIGDPDTLIEGRFVQAPLAALRGIS